MNMFDYLRSKGIEIEDVEILNTMSTPNSFGSIIIEEAQIFFLFKNKSYEVIVNLDNKKYKNDYRFRMVKICREILNKIRDN